MIDGINEYQRDELITRLAEKGISTNVHFIPIPSLKFYKELAYNAECYPNTLCLYMNEISLPIFYDLNDIQIDYVVENLIYEVEKVKTL